MTFRHSRTTGTWWATEDTFHFHDNLKVPGESLILPSHFKCIPSSGYQERLLCCCLTAGSYRICLWQTLPPTARKNRLSRTSEAFLQICCTVWTDWSEGEDPSAIPDIETHTHTSADNSLESVHQASQQQYRNRPHATTFHWARRVNSSRSKHTYTDGSKTGSTTG